MNRVNGLALSIAKTKISGPIVGKFHKLTRNRYRDIMPGIKENAQFNMVSSVAPCVWDLNSEDGAPTICFEGHTKHVQAVAWSVDGTVATASHDMDIKFWNPTTGKNTATISGGKDAKDHHQRGIKALQYSADGKTLLSNGSSGCDVKTWDVEALKLNTSYLADKTRPVATATMSADGKTVASVDSSFAADIWSTSTGELIKKLEPLSTLVLGSSFSPDGSKLAVTCFDGIVRIYDSSTFAMIGEKHIGRVKVEEQEQEVVVGDLDGGEDQDEQDEEYEEEMREEAMEHEDDPLTPNALTSVSWSPNGKQLATSSFDRSVKIIDVESMEVTAVFKGHVDTIRSTAFSPDGKKVASSGDDESIMVWDLASGKRIKTFMHPDFPCQSLLNVAWDSSSTKLVAGTNRQKCKELMKFSLGKDKDEFEPSDAFINGNRDVREKTTRIRQLRDQVFKEDDE